MPTKWRILKCIFTGLCVCGHIAAQDSLLYPEAMAPQALEEYDQSGKVSFRIACNETMDYRLKTQFTFKGFELYYLDQGGEKENEQTTSLTYLNKWFNAGAGRGQPHIAKGLILGNTMMRFTPGLTNNTGVRATKIRIGNYSYYDNLVFIAGKIGKVSTAVFRFDGVYSGFLEYRFDKYTTGMALYALEKPVIESWLNIKNDQVRASLNASFANKKLNHLCGDALLKSGKITLFGAAIYAHTELIALKSDSQWGSGLKSGSQGYAGGAGLAFSHWKINGLGYCILRNDYREQRFMLDLRYKKSPLEVIMSYSSKNILELSEADKFPFDLHWQEQLARICKLNIKLHILKQLQLSYQLQGDMMNMGSYASILRLTYKRSNDLLRLQLSNCRSCGNALYFLRPLTTSTYSIRRAPEDETLYIDLVYSKEMGEMTLYILLKNEGVNVGFNIGL